MKNDNTILKKQFILLSLGIMLLGFCAATPLCYILGANGENASL